MPPTKRGCHLLNTSWLPQPSIHYNHFFPPNTLNTLLLNLCWFYPSLWDLTGWHNSECYCVNCISFLSSWVVTPWLVVMILSLDVTWAWDLTFWLVTVRKKKKTQQKYLCNMDSASLKARLGHWEQGYTNCQSWNLGLRGTFQTTHHHQILAAANFRSSVDVTCLPWWFHTSSCIQIEASYQSHSNASASRK